MSEDDLLSFEMNLKQIVTDKYEQGVGDLFEQVKSLLI